MEKSKLKASVFHLGHYCKTHVCLCSFYYFFRKRKKKRGKKSRRKRMTRIIQFVQTFICLPFHLIQYICRNCLFTYLFSQRGLSYLIPMSLLKTTHSIQPFDFISFLYRPYMENIKKIESQINSVYKPKERWC